MLKPKFQKHEIVRIAIANVDFIKGALAHVVKTHIYDNGNIEYELLTMDGLSTDELELALEPTGMFLSPEEIEERERIMSREKKFQFNEIVQITHPQIRPYLKNQKGHVSSLSQSLTTGKWGYGVWVESEHSVVCFEEEELSATGEFLSEEKIKKYRGNGSSITVTTEGEVTAAHINSPESWQERIATPDHATGWKEDEDK